MRNRSGFRLLGVVFLWFGFVSLFWSQPNWMVQLKFGCDQKCKNRSTHSSSWCWNHQQQSSATRQKYTKGRSQMHRVWLCVCLFWCNFEILNVTDARACPSLHFPTINAHELFKHFSFSEKGVFRIFPKKSNGLPLIHNSNYHDSQIPDRTNIYFFTKNILIS